MALTPKSRERRLLIDNLRKQGNYLKNVNGYYKPVRSPQINKDNLLPCQNCHGFYSAKLLYRHKKRCLGTSAGSNCRADSQSHLASIINKKVDVQMQEQVFPRMRADKISLEAKKDPLICAFGSRYLKTHREKHFILVTSRKMRELSRLLLFMKKIDPSITNLFGALKPKYFNYFVEATKKVAQYDEVKDAYSAPTFAMNIATSLKQCCEIALTLSLTTNISTSTAEVESDLKNMIHLFTSNWRFEVSNQAANDLSIKKWNKVTIVPLADDLKKLRVHLIERAKDAITSLNNNENDEKAFTTLLETIYCRVILLNRKRPGELERMTLYSYNECINKTDYDEYDSLLTPTEKILLKSFKRVVIRGKRGRGVPVSFSCDVQDHIGLLLTLRPKFVDVKNPFLFGKPGFLTSVAGYKILQKYAHSSGAKNPSSITCTKLRKHLATLSQLFSMKETEIDQLATFMGHTIGVHKNSYRLPDDIHQVAKISKLLILLENGCSNEFKGKTLDEIDVNIEGDLIEEQSNETAKMESTYEDNDLEHNEQKTKKFMVTEKENMPRGKIKKGRKREHVPWTEEQKKVVEQYFFEHIKQKIPPKKWECEKLYEESGELLKNKEWKKIKVFIQNVYSKNIK
ncbi:uncharacterized protein [Leptinotarsa decemlineata]|uniref:uncharacterized protein n=1 Tax=Leptinotarsa decemlineata TaxID=7539 RepID=UPI003D305E03